jgi:ATP-binding cassette subfamily C protein
MWYSKSVSAVGEALRAVRKYVVVVAVISAVANLLLLAGPLFMLQVYDRVLSSGSMPTLVALTLIVAVLFGFLALFEWIRLKILARLAVVVEGRLSRPAFRASMALATNRDRRGVNADPIRDVETLRQFLSGNGPIFLFDLPWLPMFLVVVYLLHPVLGLVATVGAAILVAMTFLNERVMQAQVAGIADDRAQKFRLLQSAHQNGEVVSAMGMGPALNSRVEALNHGMLDRQLATSDTAAGFSSGIKSLRMFLQSAILAFGAALAIYQEVTPGVMIAASIIAARALAPVEQAAGGWKQFIQFRRAWSRLSQTLAQFGTEPRTMNLPAPVRSLSVVGVALTAPGLERPILHDVTFELEAGQALGVMGPSASGKTTLARALTGVWPLAAGEIRLDGACLDQWPQDARGGHVGYLPQNVELFAGTVAENISRFDPTVTPEEVIAAAETAQVHDLALRLSDGYDTLIGESGRGLSAGQRQRIGLARALLRSPFLVVLDEPNANLDAEGEDALVRAIRTMRERGSIVVVMAHRPSVIAATDMALVLSDGRQRVFGAKDEVLKKVLRPVAAAPRAA